MLRILIADDHPVFRRGLRQIISETSDMVVADEASSGWEVLAQVRASDCDVVLLDISLPGMNGLDVLRQLKNERPKLPVLMLTMYPERQFAVRALKDGASGYLTKESAPDELVAAIHKVSTGGQYVSSSLAEELASYVRNDSKKPPHEALSNREYQVMCLIASGKTVTEIADELLLSAKTISTYRSRVLGKMKMKNSAELMSYAIKNHLVD